MRRRDFIAHIGGTAAWPFTTHAQQPAIMTIGYLSTRSPGEAAYVTDAFIRGLNEGGFIEGRNLASNIAGQSFNTIDCRRSRPTWFGARLK